MYSDAHLHLYDYFTARRGKFELPPDITVCASAYDPEEFIWQEAFSRQFSERVFLSFGIHPQVFASGNSGSDSVEFLKKLLDEKRIVAIGECGFDLYDRTFRATLEEQRRVWDIQVDAALRLELPLIIHCRKALHLLFADSRRLKEIKAVIFHGWPGSLREAESFLNRGVNAFFCAGKGLLRGDKSLMETIAGLPANRILTETDAPYMKLRGEPFSSPDDIRKVAAAVARLRGCTEIEVVESAYAVFMSLFATGRGVPPAR